MHAPSWPTKDESSALLDRGAEAPLLTLPTPALVIERPALMANLDEMALRARRAGASLWPHGKTHKCAEIAGLQRSHGAAGMTVATLAEAEYFAAAGFRDILIAYPPVGEWRLRQLAALARHAQLRVVLDDAGVLENLIGACRLTGARIPYLWEVDCGTGRLGTPPGEPTAASIQAAPQASDCPFGGLMTFGGFAYGARDDAELDAAAAAERDALRQTAEALEQRGIRCPARSAGTTPTTSRLDPTAGSTRSVPATTCSTTPTQVALGLVGARALRAERARDRGRPPGPPAADPRLRLQGAHRRADDRARHRASGLSATTPS